MRHAIGGWFLALAMTVTLAPGCGDGSAAPRDIPDLPDGDSPDSPDIPDVPPALPVGLQVPADLGLGDGVTRIELLDGRLPAGVFLDATGRAWGRPVRAEDAPLKVRVARTGTDDDVLETVLRTRTGHLAILPLDDVAATNGTVFETQAAAVDAAGPVVWTVDRGALPDGVALDPATGRLAGTPAAQGLFVFRLHASDGTREARLTTAIRVGPAPLLATHAAVFEQAARERMSPNGMLLSSWPDGRYGDHGDSGMWSGTFLAGMAFKAAVTGDETMARHVLHGLTRCREIAGVNGLTCRGIEHDEWQGRTEGPNIVPDGKDRHDATVPGYAGWRWVGDVSRDQWTGHFLGNGLAFALARSPDVRTEAAANLVPMALHLWRNDLEIRDVDGAVTKYGHMSGWVMDGGLPAPNGVNAAMTLAWFQAAALAGAGTPDGDVLAAAVADMLSPAPEGWDFVADAGEYAYLDAIAQFLYPYASGYEQRKWFNMNITNDAFFQAALQLPDGDARTRLVTLWRDGMWRDQGDTPLKRRAQSEENPWFTYMYLGATADTDDDAAFEALVQMARFPAPPRLGVEIRNSDDPRFPHDPNHDAWALDPLPVEEQCSGTNFVWQRCPYELDCFGGIGQEYAGTDFVAPYWLGVAFGFLDPRW